MELMETKDIQIEVKTISSDGILVRNTKEFNDKGEEIKTTEYFLDVDGQIIDGEIEQSGFVAVEENCDGSDEEHYIAVEVENPGDIHLNEKDVISWSEICRICANTSNQFVPIFTDDGVDYDLCNKINSYLPVKVSEDDTLPHQVCYNCAATLLAWHELFKGCINAQQRLTELQTRIITRDELCHESAEEENNENLLQIENVAKIEPVTEAVKIKEDGEEDDDCNTETARCVSFGTDVIMTFVTSTSNAQEVESVPAANKEEDKPAKVVDAKAVESRRAEAARARVVVDGATLYQCPECPRLLSTAYNYQAHRRRVHARERPCHCSHCGKSFSTGSSLRRHVREVHEKIKEYKCDYCERRLASRVSRDEHQRTHTDERPHECGLCGKRFRQRASLSVHRRFHAVETSSFGFNCQVCGRDFRRKQDLQRHELTHTDLMPYACSLCDKRFRSSASAIRHRQTHERTADDSKFICDVCGVQFSLQRMLVRHIKKFHQ